MKKVFEEILEKLKGIDFAAIGTINMKLQGIDVEFNDLDFLTDDQNLEKISQIFSSPINTENGYKETEFMLDNFRIHFVSSQGNPLRTDNCHKAITINAFGLMIPAMPLESELEFYKKLNTPKALKKVELIKTFEEGK